MQLRTQPEQELLLQIQEFTFLEAMRTFILQETLFAAWFLDLNQEKCMRSYEMYQRESMKSINHFRY